MRQTKNKYATPFRGEEMLNRKDNLHMWSSALPLVSRYFFQSSTAMTNGCCWSIFTWKLNMYLCRTSFCSINLLS